MAFDGSDIMRLRALLDSFDEPGEFASSFPDVFYLHVFLQRRGRLFREGKMRPNTRIDNSALAETSFRPRETKDSSLCTRASFLLGFD